MKSPAESEPKDTPPTDAARHIAGAHRLLQALRGKVDQHPELEEAITQLEIALNILTVRTGGML